MLDRGRPHCLEYRYVSPFFHDQHGQGADDIEGRHQYYQRQYYEHHHLLQLEGRKKAAVHLDPVADIKRRPEALFQRFRDFARLVDVIDPYLDSGNGVADPEKLLGYRQVHIGKRIIVFVHSGLYGSDHLEKLAFRPLPHRSQSA